MRGGKFYIRSVMDERDDIYDEIIGAETDEFAGEPDEDDDDDDDDNETLHVRTAVLAKNELLALLSLKVTTRGSLIVRVDPRQALPAAQTYEDAGAATQWFRRSLATSRRNGWQIIYDGTPLVG